MACRLAEYDGVVVATWEKPELRDLDAVHAALARSHARYGKLPVYVTRVPADAPPPDDDVKRAMMRQIPRLLERCASFHAVMEGEGFFNTVKRSVFATLSFAAGKRKSIFVHAHAKDVIAKVAHDRRAAVVEALRDAALRGMLSDAVAQLSSLHGLVS